MIKSNVSLSAGVFAFSCVFSIINYFWDGYQLGEVPFSTMIIVNVFPFMVFDSRMHAERFRVDVREKNLVLRRCLLILLLEALLIMVVLAVEGKL